MKTIQGNHTSYSLSGCLDRWCKNLVSISIHVMNSCNACTYNTHTCENSSHAQRVKNMAHVEVESRKSKVECRKIDRWRHMWKLSIIYLKKKKTKIFIFLLIFFLLRLFRLNGSIGKFQGISEGISRQYTIQYNTYIFM